LAMARSNSKELTVAKKVNVKTVCQLR
jgi:hypothetical protein